ncbi:MULTISPECIES: eCIS core domain-containing protein [Niastella]|uniref:DUF4157 domain-containing protein n=1 Tax=Niastella soli TaxID=2821487 RepID=A0ABS3Z6T7_9BACT|nr:DUF4157 domain-containing protein [Niastella soli]MBO9205497.1 DUF4157 domain-containing protein [Niastella soli]
MKGSASLQTEKKTSIAPGSSFNKEESAMPVSVKTGAYGLLHNFGSIKVSNRESFSATPVRIQPKLRINQPGDRHEQEADAMAERVMQHSSQENAALAPKDSAGGGVAIPKSDQLLSQDSGNPLPADTQHSMENVFGTNFSNVRIHANDQAANMSEAISARAFTFGNNIYFNKGQFSPDTKSGTQLLAHELTHVVQQSASPSAQVIQRDETDEAGQSSGQSEGSYLDSLIERASVSVAQVMRRALPIPIPETILAALTAAESAFVIRGFQRLVLQGEYLSIVSRVRELASPSVALEFGARYIWGVLKGLVSPITGLVELAGAAIQFQNTALQWAVTNASRYPELISEAEGLRNQFQQFTATAQQTFQTLRQREHLMQFASVVLSSASGAAEQFEQRLVRTARQKGQDAADELVNHLLQTPLPQLAETAGEIIGTVIIELVMLLFTDGIGNLITKIGESVRALRLVSSVRGVAMGVEMVIQVGRVIAELEHIIGALMSRTVMRPLMPLFEALEPLLGRMRQFAQRFAGRLSGEAGTTAARAGVTAVERTATDAARTGTTAVERSTTGAARTGTTAVEQSTTASARATEQAVAQPPRRPQLRSIQGGGQRTAPRTGHLQDVSAPSRTAARPVSTTAAETAEEVAEQTAVQQSTTGAARTATTAVEQSTTGATRTGTTAVEQSTTTSARATEQAVAQPPRRPQLRAVQGSGQTTAPRSGHLQDVSAPSRRASRPVSTTASQTAEEVAEQTAVQQTEAVEEQLLAAGAEPRGPVASASSGGRRPPVSTRRSTPSRTSTTTTTGGGGGGSRSSTGQPRRGFELDEETQEMLSGSRVADDETRALPEELRDLTVQEMERFPWQVSEEELSLIQAEFPDLPAEGWFRQRPVVRRGGQSVVIERGRTPRGSTIPELYHPGTPTHPPISLEAKNYLLDDIRVGENPELMRDFIERTADQARRRATQLPANAEQHILIDIRGQQVSQAARDGIRRDLERYSEGALQQDRIRFLD